MNGGRKHWRDIADEGEMTWESLILLEQRAEFYQMKSIQDALSNLTVFSYHLILIAVKRELVKEQEDYLIKMRRYFHMNPELSNKEFETRKTIISELEKMGVEYRLAAGTGLVAIIKGGKPGKHHLLRCDMDALPVKEDTDNLIQPKACVSQKPGVCHACGHDAHMAMMLTTIRVLSQVRAQLKGTVY